MPSAIPIQGCRVRGTPSRPAWAAPAGPVQRRGALLACLAGASLAAACGLAGAGGEAAAGGDLRVARKAVEDVYILTGEVRAVRALPLGAPRGHDQLQIRWLAEDGAEVAEGDLVAELDASRLAQTVEEQRLRLRQARLDRESRARSAAADADRKRVAVERAEVEVQKARIDAAVPRELRPAQEWSQFQATLKEKQAALEKARLEQEAFVVSSRSDLASARAAEEKAARELAAAEQTLRGLSVRAPRAGIFLINDYWQWGPEGPRKFQPGDTIWAGYPIGSLPDPSEMEVQAALAGADHGRVAAGMPARCVLDTYPDQVFDGVVAQVASLALESRRGGGAAARPAFPVRVQLARADPRLRPGLSVRVEVLRGSWPAVLSVPRGAVRFEAGGPVVGRPGGRTTGVRLGACTPVECVVEAGLQEGDRVAPL